MTLFYVAFSERMNEWCPIKNNFGKQLKNTNKKILL